MPGSLLILGGTAAARLLAVSVHAEGRPVVSSLAGRTSSPNRLVGDVRVGAFGGVEGLVAFLRASQTTAVVDATHPFAARMSNHAVEACRRTGTPLLVLTRPSWAQRPDARTWFWADDHREAAILAQALGQRVLLTVGSQAAVHYREVLADVPVLVRVAEPLGFDVPSSWSVAVGRGPFDLEGERRLLRRHDIGALVTKDSGGSETEAKLHAAAEAGVAVVAVRRPPVPSGVPTVVTVEEALMWCLSQ